MKNYFLPLVVFFLLVTACEKVVDSDTLLGTEEKVFIRSYLSPQDTVFRVHVSRAFSSVGTPLSVSDFEANENKFLIKNAQVVISDETGKNVDLVYSEEDKNYLADTTELSIVSNQSYFLKVTVDGKEFNASCKIPASVDTIDGVINLRDDGFGGQLADINLSFQDIMGGRNFYVLGGSTKTTFQYEGEEPETVDYRIFFDTDKFQTDALQDGGTINGKSLVSIGNGIEIIVSSVTLRVAHVEEVLYQNLRAASINADAEEDPFVEYSIAPNNFQEDGAIGVFAGYQLTEKEIIIE